MAASPMYSATWQCAFQLRDYNGTMTKKIENLILFHPGHFREVRIIGHAIPQFPGSLFSPFLSGGGCRANRTVHSGHPDATQNPQPRRSWERRVQSRGRGSASSIISHEDNNGVPLNEEMTESRSRRCGGLFEATVHAASADAVHA